jgi:hypothetical protein
MSPLEILVALATVVWFIGAVVTLLLGEKERQETGEAPLAWPLGALIWPVLLLVVYVT